MCQGWQSLWKAQPGRRHFYAEEQVGPRQRSGRRHPSSRVLPGERPASRLHPHILSPGVSGCQGLRGDISSVRG